MNKIAIILVILLIGGSTYGLQEVEAIEKIVGYVTEAKKKALAEEEAKANATAIEEYVDVIETQKGEDTTNRSDDPIENVVQVIRGVLGFEVEAEPEKQYTKIVGIQLSKTCLQMERNNVTANCPTYNDLMQLGVDNTLPEISGNVTLSDGYWHRDQPDYKKHCNYYLDKYPVLIIVDPDGCWQRETGIRMIYIQALDPDKLIFKLKYDRDVIDELQDLTRDERNIDDEKDEADREIDRLEDEIEDFEDRIRDLEDELDKPVCKKDDDRKLVLNDGCSSSLQSRNFNFQLRFALTGLEKTKTELIEEERIYLNATEYLDSTRINSQEIKSRYSSTTMFDGSVSMGVGRYVEECRNATIGADLDLLMDTLNYLIFACSQDSTTFNAIQTTVKEQTPLYIGNFTEYKYKAWLAEAKERCKESCKDY